MKDILWPGPGFQRQVLDVGSPTLRSTYSGEIKATMRGLPLGTADIDGYVKNVWFSLLKCGRDDTNALYATVDVKINDTTCLTTQPRIDRKHSAASTNRTTVASGEGVIQAVLDSTAISVSRGDVLTWDINLTRTATPTTEMADLCVVVELVQ